MIINNIINNFINILLFSDIRRRCLHATTEADREPEGGRVFRSSSRGFRERHQNPARERHEVNRHLNSVRRLQEGFKSYCRPSKSNTIQLI